jgi:hypothetical protein
MTFSEVEALEQRVAKSEEELVVKPVPAAVHSWDAHA